MLRRLIAAEPPAWILSGRQLQRCINELDTSNDGSPQRLRWLLIASIRVSLLGLTGGLDGDLNRLLGHTTLAM